MKRLILVSVLIALQVFGYTQKNGSITGKVIDESNGETLPLVNVWVGSLERGAATDFNGVFEIKDVPPGKYSVKFTYISYNDVVINDVVVTEGKATTLNVTMKDVAITLDSGVVIVYTIDKGGPLYEIIERKNTVNSMDGISNANIKKTPDSKTSDVLKRVSGASIQENKFVIIRGLNDRYNAAFLNGSPLPSSESDRKAFSFDIFPSNMLDNLVILKTATPDLPGDFAGGVIQINTKSIPEEKQYSFTMSSTYNPYVTFQNFIPYNTGKFDWLGIDDGSRKLSSEIPSTEEYKQLTDNTAKAGYAEKMLLDWGLKGMTALPSLSLQTTAAGKTTLFKKDFGVIAGLTYQNNPSVNHQERAEFDDFDTGSIKTMYFRDTVYNRNILSSAIVNFAMKLNNKNSLSLKNIASINSDSRVILREGALAYDQPEPYFQKASTKWFTQNIFYSSQLAGEHLLSEKKKIKFNWITGYSLVKRDIPALLRNVYERDPNTGQYFCLISDQANLVEGGNMFFSNSTEDIKSASYNLSIPADLSSKFKNTVKIGGYHQFRDREFYARSFKFGKYKQGSSIKFDDEILFLPQEEIFTAHYMGLMPDSASPYKGGFKLNEITKVSDSYKAGSVLHAGYIMLDDNIGTRHRLVWGLRVESYRQQFDYTEEGTNIEKGLDTTVVDLLPSANYIFSINEKSNLRASYYRTVSRPEFRELAPFQFYNFIQLNIWSGDPGLKRALIDNFDLRYEYYPGGPQLISVTGFYKKFQDPIESIQRTAVSGGNELYFANITGATNYGAELEYRLNLGFIRSDSVVALYDSSKINFLQNTTLFTNVSFIKSVVDAENILGAVDRPLQGQSPYIINAGLHYLHPKTSLGISVSYNVVGPRIFVVGNVQEPHIREKQRHVLDVQLSKSFLSNRLEVKLNARDALAQEQIFYQDINLDNNATETEDNFTWRIKYAPSYSFNISYKF